MYHQHQNACLRVKFTLVLFPSLSSAHLHTHPRNVMWTHSSDYHY